MPDMEIFSRLFKPKFYKKCESSVNTIKIRIEYIQRKRKVVQKILKNDIAELLRCGRDYDAYRRAAGLLMDYNKTSCYELVEKFTVCISNHLDDLSKQSDSPEECKEAVQSLIYAAARFSDLPELRELRSLFTQKYGNSLKPYVNKEFVEKLRQEVPAREITILLLHDIAGEFSIEWDSQALEQQLYRPLSMHEERTKHEERSKNNEGINQGFLSQGRKNIVIDGSSDDEDETTSAGMSSQKASSSSSSSVGSVSEDEEESKRPFYYRLVPPPYLKPKPNNKAQNYSQKEPEKPRPRSVRRRSIQSTSLPPQSATMEASTGPERAAFKHVHPKLPDYDDLATCLASIKQRA